MPSGEVREASIARDVQTMHVDSQNRLHLAVSFAILKRNRGNQACSNPVRKAYIAYLYRPSLLDKLALQAFHGETWEVHMDILGYVQSDYRSALDAYTMRLNPKLNWHELIVFGISLCGSEEYIDFGEGDSFMGKISRIDTIALGIMGKSYKPPPGYGLFNRDSADPFRVVQIWE